MRRSFWSTLVTAVAMAVGLLVLVHFFITNPLLEAVSATLTGWAALIAGFAMLLALFNLLIVHFSRVFRRNSNSWTSLVILLTASVVFVIVLPSGGASAASTWMFRYLYQPLEASFLALLVFFIGTAAYRALRVRNWETTLFVIAALIVLLGAAPISRLISPLIPAAKDWVLNVPTVAGVRGILLGVGLGVIATGLRLLTGADRPYAE